MSDKILVTGATGVLGRELVARLAGRGVEVKAGTRNPERAHRLFDTSVEVVDLDYDVTETWDAALQWADRVFLVAPPFDPRADERLVPFLDWAVQSGSRHVVLLSAMGVETRERLALRRVEQRVASTGVNWTFLRPNVYMQNFARGFIARSIREHDVFRLSAGSGAVSFVDARDVAEVADLALDGDEHVGAEYTLTGPGALDHAEVARHISAALGRDVRYEPIEHDEMRDRLIGSGWKREQADTFAGLLGSIREGDRAAVTDEIPHLLGRRATDFDTFATSHTERWR